MTVFAAVKRGLIGEIIQRYEDYGLEIVKMEMRRATPELAAAHADREFYHPPSSPLSSPARLSR